MRWKNRIPRLSEEISRLSELSPHELLNISPDSSIQEIKIAYRKMIKVYHPDKADPFLKNYNERVTKLLNTAFYELMKESVGKNE